jgi:Na+-driven multidrug efflux pump
MIAGSYLFMAAFLAFIYQIIDRCDSVLSGLRKPSINVFYTFIRLVFLPPFIIYLFSETLEKGLVGIWWAIFFTNLFGSVFVYFHMRYLFKKKASLELNELT